MYISVPEGISPWQKSEIKASAMLLAMSSTAQAYWILLLADIKAVKYKIQRPTANGLVLSTCVGVATAAIWVVEVSNQISQFVGSEGVGCACGNVRTASGKLPTKERAVSIGSCSDGH